MELVLNLFFLAPKAKIFPHTTPSGINLFTVMIQVMGSPKIVENRGKESNFRSQQLYTMPSKHSCFFFFFKSFSSTPHTRAFHYSLEGTCRRTSLCHIWVAWSVPTRLRQCQRRVINRSFHSQNCPFRWAIQSYWLWSLIIPTSGGYGKH